MFKIYSLIIIIYWGFYQSDKDVKWNTLDACKIYLKIFISEKSELFLKKKDSCRYRWNNIIIVVKYFWTFARNFSNSYRRRRIIKRVRVEIPSFLEISEV